MPQVSRIAARYTGVLVGALVVVSLSACSGGAGSSGFGTSSSTARSSGGSESSSAAGSPGAPGSPGTAGSSAAALSLSAPGGAGSSVMSVASCSGTSCSVALAGAGSKVDVLGTTIVLRGVRDGTAELRMGGHDISCSQGERISIDSLRLECAAVTGNGVRLTVS
jgi:hypothetical protein